MPLHRFAGTIRRNKHRDDRAHGRLQNPLAQNDVRAGEPSRRWEARWNKWKGHPPYGILFNSNFQWSTTSRDVKDGKAAHITREPEQVKAFRDTWRDGIHPYLTYLRDRLTVARDLLTESGSVFVQIGDENVHRVRALMDEVFGEENFISLISIQTTTGFLTDYLGNMSDFILCPQIGPSRMTFETDS